MENRKYHIKLKNQGNKKGITIIIISIISIIIIIITKK